MAITFATKPANTLAPSAVRSSRRQPCVVAMASPSEVSRRQAMWLPALLTAAAALAAPGAAQAGGAPKNGSFASMSSFSMEGTKKRGVSPKRKQAVLEKLKGEIAEGKLS
ncbi:hypothetical protein M9435_006042 [Picochlorum sp. BPE23]|nr:hypothetical protein M9435_006042 [Picochlorum sp. BPE23]|eukprot:jgi/Picre1/32793/NNA_008124.t1